MYLVSVDVTDRSHVAKIQKYYIIFVYILQGKTEKRKENHTTKVTKIPKTWDEQSI